MGVSRVLLVVISATVFVGCGTGTASRDADLQGQLDEANARADAAEAELQELRSELGIAASDTTPSGADNGVRNESKSASNGDATSATGGSDLQDSGSSAAAADPAASKYVTGFGDLSVIRLPEGKPGKIDVIVSGTELDKSGSLPVILRNNTDKSAGSIEVTGRARVDGGLVGSGASHDVEPVVTKPGEIAWGYVYFDHEGVPAGASFELSVSADEPSDYAIGVPVEEVSHTGGNIVGLVENDTSDVVGGPVSVSVACFDSSGTFLGTKGGFTDESEIPAGGTASFTVGLYDAVCDIGLVAASGWAF